MRSIALVNNKGGCGKSTLSVNIAVALMLQGKRVWLVDMDPLGTVLSWGDERAENADLKRIHIVGAHPGILARQLMNARDDGADYVILDTPKGSDISDVAGSAAVAGAHLVVIPTRPNAADANAMVKTVNQARAEDRRAVVLFNEVENGPPKAREAGDEDVAVTTHDMEVFFGAKMPEVCPLTVRHHREIAVAFREGKGVLELVDRKHAAAKQVLELTAWIVKEVEPKLALPPPAQPKPRSKTRGE